MKLISTIVYCFICFITKAQDLEPRAYANVPKGMNVISAVYALSSGDVLTDTSLPIIGASIVISVPTGLYYRDKRINLGSNRWAIKPEVGVSKKFKRFYAEAYTGVWFYTHNDEFLTNKTLKQQPVLSLQAHVSYYFKNQMWIGVNGNWFNGGKTLVD